MSLLPYGIIDKFKSVFKNPMIVFVYGIVSKWYITIFVTAIVVTYWVFRGLSDSGLIQAAEDVVFKAFNDTKSVARFCVPKITNFGDFWDCLQNPPEYNPSQEEKTLERNVKNLFDIGDEENKNPYAK